MTRVVVGLSLTMLLFIAGCLEPMTEEQMAAVAAARESTAQAETEARDRQRLAQQQKDDAYRAFVAIKENALKTTWRKTGFGTIMEADFTITNPTDQPWRDFLIRCFHYAPSGTVIGTKSDWLHYRVAPHSKKTIPAFNMGFINQQVESVSCRIVSLTEDPAPPPTTVDPSPAPKAKPVAKLREKRV